MRRFTSCTTAAFGSSARLPCSISLGMASSGEVAEGVWNMSEAKVRNSSFPRDPRLIVVTEAALTFFASSATALE